MVPTKDNGGGSISFLRGGGGLTGVGSAATASGGGRREGENIGRSRVPDNCVSGTPHSGLALSVRCGVAGGAVTRTVVTGSEAVGDSGSGVTDRDTSVNSPSSASPDMTPVAATAHDSDRPSTRTPIAKPRFIRRVTRRLIWRLAIARKPRAEPAACPFRRRHR